MRHFLALSAVAVLLAGGAAYAQSNQGGYIGKKPGANAPTGQATPPRQGMGQGGYLGKDPGANASTDQANPPAQGSGQGGYLGTNSGGATSSSGSSGVSDKAGGAARR